jgi:4-amino-4-deoxy-L-arabinose transferase-like glycosyltransferase
MKYEKIILIAAAGLFLWFLGAHDLWAPDEPFFGEGAREMLVDGQWLVSHVNGVLNTHKPPLFFWLIAIFSIPLGAVTEFTARLPSVLAGLGTLWLTMRLGLRWYGAKTAALAGVILMTTFMFWDKARWSQTDSVLCFLIWLSLFAFDRFRSGSGSGRWWGVLFWFALVLAVLDKGPVGLLLPLGIAVITLTLDRGWGRIGQFAPLLGPLVFVAVASAWIIAVDLWGPPEYSVLGALKEHFVERGIHGMHHAQPPWYYLSRLPTSIMPWAGLIPGALYLAWKRRSVKTDRLALVCCVFVFVFFTISTEKRDLYMLPSFPAWALLFANLIATACRLDRTGENSFEINKKWVTLGHGIVLGLVTLVALGLPFVASDIDEIPYWMACVVALILLVLGTSSLFFVFRKKPVSMILASGAGMYVAYLFTAAVIYPSMEPVKSARSFALEMKEITATSRSEGNQVLAWRIGNLPNAFAFYSDGVYTLETTDANVLIDHMNQEAEVFALVLADDLNESMRQSLSHSWVVEDTLLSRRHVLLLSNVPHAKGKPLLAP